jgi:hypothetical protein
MSQPFAPVTPETRDLYTRLLEALKAVGPYRVDVKKYSLQLMRRISFAGVHPRKNFLLLTVKSDVPIDNTRVIKAEQVSKSRWQLDLKLTSAAEIDAELLGLLRHAYEICE